ncbi:MAG: phosphoenolpyruvate--protein phosphotransferase [Clostridia bacterium]|nr:phosphoenolpyruvate--protein phosphotransferase [Clostridia bacterium]
MTVLKGKGVSGGIALGRLLIYEKREKNIKRYRVENAENEIKRFEDAKKEAIFQLQHLYDKALQEVGETHAMIFDIHQMMLNDLDYCDSIINIIRSQNVNAEYAVAATADNFAMMFSAMDDSYMKERAADVRDISERVLNILSDASENSISGSEPVIVAAEDLTPSQTVQMDKDKVLGFVTMKGSSNSHTAILARTMNIPAVVNAGEFLKPEYDGQFCIIDGFSGNVYIDPDEATIKHFIEKQKEDRFKRELLSELKGKKNITLDGQEINIYANIGNLSDLGSVLQNDAGGVGLFRSEFLYLEKLDFPTEEEQFNVYKTAAETMAGKKLIIRTLDIGADKQAKYFNLPNEENPAMGYRAIRICLQEKEIFKTQLRALYRASAYGQIAIMFPMITSLKEIKEIKKVVKEVKSELLADGIPFDESVELGIMIETPAAVIISDILAKEVDFFSIGTNDLTQYALAVDRQNPKLDWFYDPHHKAIIRMIKMAADNAHQNGIWIGICGELASDLELTETFLSIGIDELSVSPGLILELRKKVREIDVSKIRDDIIRNIEQ